MLNPDDLNVESFPTNEAAMIGGGGYCCTGCTSGCGINPTAGYCESKSGDAFCPVDPIAVE
ncbi:MAG TPA: hypothetical protein VFJ82_03190 [Longimicrobium sp.]|nr:hypothetical protein [Longimicrobium sp.]